MLKKKDTSPFTPKNVLNLFIVYELHRWPRDRYTNFTLKDYFFGAVELTKNTDPDKCKYSGWLIGFDPCTEFSLSNDSIGKNVIICGVIMISSVHIDNKK